MQKNITSIFGYQQITSLSAATNLTVPAVDKNGAIGGPTMALIRCESQNVRWRDDGTAPTASVGQLLNTGDAMEYDGDLKRIQFIETSASAKLNICYYS